jgi:hypothetical protein
MPHPADAIAMENPAAIATQLVPLASPPCANAGTAKQSDDRAMNKLLSTRLICFFLL